MNTNMVTSVESSLKYKSVPPGVRVLVVDVDSTCLKIVSAMLRALDYDVKTVERSRDALLLIRERKDEIDVILIEFHMPDMNGLELIETIERESILPVAVMSADDNEHVMLHCIIKGAQMYFTKPFSMDEAKSLWQFTITKRVARERMEKNQMDSSNENRVEESSRRWKILEKEIQRQMNRTLIVQKSKLIWTDDLHEKFLDAVQELGVNSAHPKQILEYMKIPGLTKENISSHLQKYRASMRREQEGSKSVEPTGKKTSQISGSVQSNFGLYGPPKTYNLRGRSPKFLKADIEKMASKFGHRHFTFPPSQQLSDESSSNGVGTRISGGNIETISKGDMAPSAGESSGVWGRKP